MAKPFSIDFDSVPSEVDNVVPRDTSTGPEGALVDNVDPGENGGHHGYLFEGYTLPRISKGAHLFTRPFA